MSDITENVRHLMLAFLCPVNRATTMTEHSCDEMGLFKNPSWLLEHYFQKSGVELSEEEKREVEDFIKTRNGTQITEAFLCPVNRHCTRLECECCDEDFLKGNNYEKLIMHYVLNGGALEFAKKREKLLNGEGEEKINCGCG